MIRWLVTTLRTLVVGPILSQLSELKDHEVRNLAMYSSTGFLNSALLGKRDPATDKGLGSECDTLQAELIRLRSVQSGLEERIQVLETMLYHRDNAK